MDELTIILAIINHRDLPEIRGFHVRKVHSLAPTFIRSEMRPWFRGQAGRLGLRHAKYHSQQTKAKLKPKETS